MRILALTTSLVALSLAMPHATRADIFANQTIAYTPGAAVFIGPDNALGEPSPIVPGDPASEFEFEGEVFPIPATPPEPLNPFVPAKPDELTQIGIGGELIVQLERFVEIGTGLELGVFGNVGLADANFGQPADQRAAVADTTGLFGAFGVDEVRIEVSETGLPGSWAVVAGTGTGGRVVIDTPSTAFVETLGLQGTPGDLIGDSLTSVPGFTSLIPAEYGQPFENTLGIARFNGLTLAQIEAEFAGSAGGDWFDLNGLSVVGEPLERVGFVRFSDPASTFELMAVSINSQLAGALVPEPTSLALLIGLAVCTFPTRKH